jgi:CelD/BcsL family acetyltransferase involved in cellulose biosynthesis
VTRVRTIRLGGVDAVDLERWRALAADAYEANPFYEPDFLLPAAEHLGLADMRLLVAESEERWTGCVPVAALRWRPQLPALMAWHGMYAYLCTPLLGRDDVEDAIAAMVAEGSRIAGRQMLVGSRVSVDARLSSALAASLKPARRHQAGRLEVERAVLRRHPDGEYLSHLKPHHKREYKRQRRRFEEALGAPLEMIDRAGDPEAVESFLALERGGWKGRAGTAFASAGDDDFFREVCRRFAAAGRLQLLELSAGDSVVAMKCNLHAGEGSFAFKIAFDEEHARYSPGIQLELENIRAFHDAGLKWMDSCADPDNQMINRLWADRRRLCTVVLAKDGPASAPNRIVFALGVRLNRRRQNKWTVT